MTHCRCGGPSSPPWATLEDQNAAASRGRARLPPESFVTVAELRAAVVEWAFGDAVPPSAVSWTGVTGLDWF